MRFTKRRNGRTLATVTLKFHVDEEFVVAVAKESGRSKRQVFDLIVDRMDAYISAHNPTRATINTYGSSEKKYVDFYDWTDDEVDPDDYNTLVEHGLDGVVTKAGEK